MTQNQYIPESSWHSIFKIVFISCSDTYLQSIQYKVIHRIFQCQYWLYRCNVIDNPTCKFCNDIDNLFHYFTECGNLFYFWETFNRWWNRISTKHIVLTTSSILLGLYEDIIRYKELNYCGILAKNYIVNRKKSNCNHFDFFDFLVILKQKLEQKRIYYSLIFKYEMFDTKWSSIIDKI